MSVACFASDACADGEQGKFILVFLYLPFVVICVSFLCYVAFGHSRIFTKFKRIVSFAILNIGLLLIVDNFYSVLQGSDMVGLFVFDLAPILFWKLVFIFLHERPKGGAKDQTQQ